MLRWAAKIITSKSSSCYHIDTNVTSPNPFTSTLYIILSIASVSIYHTCVPKGIPKTWNFCSITDLIKGCHTQRRWILSPTIRWSNAHVFQDTGAKSMACIWACPVIQAPICMAASTGNLSDPKNDDRNVVTPNCAAERFSFEERELVDHKLMQWVNQNKSNMSLNESLVSQEKPAWIKNESKKHVPYQYVPYERAECAPK